MQKIFYFFFLLPLGINSCDNHVKVEPGKQQVSDLKIHIFLNDTIKTKTGEQGYGYDVLKNGTVYIHQPIIPAVAGNQGFSSESHAQKTAEFVVYKIAHNIIPPSVSYEELDSLGVLDQ